MLKIGVFGAGHLGKIHIKCIGLSKEYKLKGFCETDTEVADHVEKELSVRSYRDAQKLIDKVDVVDIVTPTPSHFQIARLALSSGKHVFIEKPITDSIEEAEELICLAEKNNVKIQVGHVERFNPAFLTLKDHDLDPMFIEGHRLATFNPRGTDVSVVLDLMIHDIDMILHLVKSRVCSVQANGVAIVNDSADICNARIEFENGCVANLTASRISIKQMRRLRLFQSDAYIAIDFLKKESQIVKLSDHKPEHPHAMKLDLKDKSKWIVMEQPEAVSNNAILEELNRFALSINEDTDPEVSAKDALKALRLAYMIEEIAISSISSSLTK